MTTKTKQRRQHHQPVTQPEELATKALRTLLCHTLDSGNCSPRLPYSRAAVRHPHFAEHSCKTGHLLPIRPVAMGLPADNSPELSRPALHCRGSGTVLGYRLYVL